MLENQFFVIAQYGHNITLWTLLALSFVSLAFIAERWFFLRGAITHSTEMAKNIQEVLVSHSFQDLEKLAENKKSIEGRALAYGLRHVKEHGVNGLEELFMSYANNEKPILENRLSFLATVGSNAPFIGLLGTVFGIMDAFRGLANSQGEVQAVMAGISQALVATAVGLMVAIPAVIAYNYFQRKVKRIMMNLESTKDLCLAFAKTKNRNS
jgi:biopolymer transport protein TolQ